MLTSGDTRSRIVTWIGFYNSRKAAPGPWQQAPTIDNN
jgi:hypothetical protein